MVDLQKGDCLELMKDIRDKSIDMVLCDLPYSNTRNKWDNVINLVLLWKQYKRIIKDNGAIVLHAQTPFDKILGCSNLKMLRYEWIWEKDRATGHFHSKKMPMKAHENILVFYKKLPTYNPQKTTGHKPVRMSGAGLIKSTTYGDFFLEKKGGQTDRFPRSIYKCNVVNNMQGGGHPTQKPIKLIEMLIKTYTNEGDIILDNAMGSGTTGVGCVNLKRNFIGIELGDDFFIAAEKRIKEALKRNNCW